MCIIAYKSAEQKFPSKKTLKRCFDNNDDGAGFMFNASGTVYIKKGFTTFSSFWKTLRSAREKYGEDIPYVMHFRISTQAGTRPDCTHPFPLSSHMKDLRLLDTKTNIGIAHNGIISLTSEWGHKGKELTYSDTMTFITDYLSLIIKNKNWYKDKDTVQLISNLMGSSRFAILDNTGHCELLGSGWIYDNGIWYSNSTYKKSYTYSGYSYWDDHYDWGKISTKVDRYITETDTDEERALADDVYSYADACYNIKTNEYDLDPSYCPSCMMGDDGYCDMCSHFNKCFDIGRPYSDYSALDDYEWARLNK